MRRRFRLRGLEWEHACIAIGWGPIVMLNPSIFDSPAFAAFWGGPMLWGLFVFLVGVFNVVALIVNGAVPRPTAIGRTASAVLQVLLFLLISTGLILSGTGTTGAWTYGMLALFGFPAAAWAFLDAVAPEYHDE